MPPVESSQIWDVVATIDEPPALALAFAAWHLEQGAGTLHLYLDNPDDPVGALLDGTPRIRVTRCGEDHWKGRRPSLHQMRQRRNATRAAKESGADWLFHIDADEFLRSQTSVADTLPTDGTPLLRVPVAERIYRPKARRRTIFAGDFRRPSRLNRSDGMLRFGPAYGLTRRGLSGHAFGKVAARPAAVGTFSLHRAWGEVEGDLPEARAAGLELLHFDGLTPLHWVQKLLRKTVPPEDGIHPVSAHQKEILEMLLEAPREAAGLHDVFKAPAADLREELAESGLILAEPFDPRPAIRRHFPGVAVDLSPAAFDRWLWGRHGRLLDGIDLPAALRRSRP